MSLKTFEIMTFITQTSYLVFVRFPEVLLTALGSLQPLSDIEYHPANISYHSFGLLHIFLIFKIFTIHFIRGFAKKWQRPILFLIIGMFITGIIYSIFQYFILFLYLNFIYVLSCETIHYCCVLEGINFNGKWLYILGYV